MKGNILKWLAVDLMVMACVLSVCGCDDDGTITGSSDGRIVVDGDTIGIPFGFCSYDEGRWSLHFYNWNAANPSTYPSSANRVDIDFEAPYYFVGDLDDMEVPLGEFDKFHVYVVRGITSDSEGLHWEGSTLYSNPTDARLVIRISDDKYSVRFSGLTMSDDSDNYPNTSFSYLGPLFFRDDME